MDNLAVFAVAGAENLIERLAMRVIRYGVVEFATHDEIDILATVQAFHPA